MAEALQAASRESMASAQVRLDAYADSAQAADLQRLGDELFAVTRLLVEQRSLRRLLADPSSPEAARTGLLERLLGQQVGAPAQDVAKGLVGARWSRPGDLVTAFESVARQALLAVAEKDGSLDNVEDELFRFGRLVDREPELGSLLVDTATPADGRVTLLDRLVEGKTSPVTTALLRHTVRLPRDRHIDAVCEELADLAAGRRDRSVARVTTPVALSPEQEQKLTDSLTRLYGRRMSLQIELDPSLLGGLVVQVGGEVIDGSVASKLAAARRSLPS
ncbi:F-type H+-transporting ATPase subunit delta [Pseudonocardia hierapolitana]|uniref:ATP synthase subunit delta n=1 Tax=Pseudonocardia hierapolitana TaxID=1128676 RepID=A0A561SVB7_9PSEU|nr:F0F1 ATP synthase subunit delta [Pseudonocardia hierapolitana]TWF78786.1 F-type H+-transporting ATPase subunit delta [Pseudonocardia hierapolitana]